jgi:hypothetical protein
MLLEKARSLYEDYFGEKPSSELSLEQIAQCIGEAKEMGINKKEVVDSGDDAIIHFVNQLDKLPLSITLPKVFSEKEHVNLYASFSRELKDLCLEYSRKALKISKHV